MKLCRRDVLAVLQRLLFMFVDVVDDEESSVVNSEPDVEYTEVVHPQPVDPNRGKDTLTHVQ